MFASITGFWILVFVSLGVHSNCVPEWKLVFVAVSGNGQSVYNRWRERLPDGCCEMKNGCLPEKASLAFTSPPRKHLKSPLVDKWKTLGIKKVKVELFKDGLRKVFLVFNGKGSDSMSWFSKSRLLTDSWEDLYKGGTFNYFSIKGNKEENNPCDKILDISRLACDVSKHDVAACFHDVPSASAKLKQISPRFIKSC